MEGDRYIVLTLSDQQQNRSGEDKRDESRLRETGGCTSPQASQRQLHNGRDNNGSPIESDGEQRSESPASAMVHYSHAVSMVRTENNAGSALHSSPR